MMCDFHFNEEEFNDFNTAVKLIVDICQFKSKELLKSCETTLVNVLGFEETRHLLNAAIYQLANTSPETFCWTWQHFPDFEACMELKDYVVMFVVRLLINKNFVLGQDFSINSDGNLLMTQRAKAILMLNTYPSEWMLIKELVQVTESRV